MVMDNIHYYGNYWRMCCRKLHAWLNDTIHAWWCDIMHFDLPQAMFQKVSIISVPDTLNPAIMPSLHLKLISTNINPKWKN